jgi:hypothetical protein
MSGLMAASATAARSHEEMFTYWASRRQGGRLPARAQIDPCDLKRHLPTVSLIEVISKPRAYRQRLAGTGLYGVYGREITGKMLDDVYSPQAADYWRTQLDQVVDEARPCAGFHSLAWRGAPHLSILWIRLPLSSNGREVDMILGYDAIVGSLSDTSGIRAA